VKLVPHFLTCCVYAGDYADLMSSRHSELFTAELQWILLLATFVKKNFHTSDLLARASITNEQTLSTSNSNITSDDTYVTNIPLDSDDGPFLT